MRTLLTVAMASTVLAVAGCPNVTLDPGEEVGQLPEPVDGPTVEFDPANSIIPFPNNLLIDPTTGRVSIPASACEAPATTALREGVLNTLNGFGTYEVPLQATFTATPGSASITSADVVIYKRAENGSALDGVGAQPVTTATMALSQQPRFSASDCSTPTMIDTLTLVPAAPLDENSTYVVALLQGITDGSGTPFIPSFTWSLIRQSQDPVTVDANGNITVNNTPLDPVADKAELLGINELWQAEAPELTFLDGALGSGSAARSNILLAWDFNTQTTTDPLDAQIPTSPAGTVSSDPPVAIESITGGATPEQFMEAAIPGGCQAQGGYLACQEVGGIFGGVILSTSYQTDTPNPLGGSATPVPGPWTDPYHPTAVHTDAQLPFVAFVPTGTPPANGWPVVIFGHGLGGDKTNLFAIAPQFANQGIASIAIDFVASGDRAVQVSADPSIGCGSAVSYSSTPQCYVPILTTDLATTRDNIRQTVLDLHRVHAMLAACGTSGCPNLPIDGTAIGYTGISLGGIIGTTFTSTAALPAAVLNVAAVGLLDILENSKTPAISCPLVDALIDAGVLTGAKASPNEDNPTSGLCLAQTWTMQPSYETFAAAARWVLDPADGANFTPKLAQQHFLFEEVVNDQVVPNVAGNREGELTGLTAGSADSLGADVLTGTAPEPSAVVFSGHAGNLWVRYTDLPADASTSFPGNLFQHASLLEPVSASDPAAGGSVIPGVLGTLRIQVDAIGYLVLSGIGHL